MARVNLSPARLIVLVALVVGGVAVLLNGFDSDGDVAAVGGTSPSPSVSLSVSPTPTTTPTPTDAANTPEPEVDGVTFAVFNGTSSTGLAGEVQQMLEDEGYVVGQEATNAPTPGIAKTTVYYRGGADAEQAKSNATNMADEFLDGAEVKLLGAEYETLVPEDTQLVVVVGADYPGAEA
jgi:LytR cell envelope-related transcriptional attenuator